MGRFSRATVVLVTVVAVGVVFGAGYAIAAGTQQQGVPQKLYAASDQTFVVPAVDGTNWVPVPNLTVTGTWQPGDLLVAHFDAGTFCVSTVAGVPGRCRIRIGLTGPDPGAPNLEFTPIGADTFALDTATGTVGGTPLWQAHGVTRYLQVPAETPGTVSTPLPLVWAEVSVSDPTIRFALNLPVLTVEITSPTVT